MQTGYTGVKNMNESIGWIGGGRVARILLSGWKEAGMTLENIVVSDPDGMALDRIIQDYPGVSVIKDGDAVAAGQDLVFLAIPPAAAETVLPAIKPVLKPGTIVISTIPGLSFDQISRMLGDFDRIVRIIPNAPSMIGSGYTPVFFPPSFLRQDSEPVEYLMESISHIIDVQEEHLEAYAVISAMGPACLWFQLYELVAIAESMGISRELASDAVCKMAEGAVQMMTWSTLSPSQMMDLVPVHPLAEDEAAIREIYWKRLPDLHKRLKG